MKLLAPGNSKHHLFTYYEIRNNLVLLYGHPKTDEEHLFIQKLTRSVHKDQRTFGLDNEFHKKLHNT